MEPISVSAIAATAITLLFSEAAKESGKRLGESSVVAISSLSKLISSKLGRSEQAILEAEPEVVEAEIINAAENDPQFAKQMVIAVEGAEANTEIRQVILEKATIKGKDRKLTIDGVIQKTDQFARKITQVIGGDIEIDGDISISNVSQISNTSEES